MESFSHKSEGQQPIHNLSRWLAWDSKSCTCFAVGALVSFVVAYIGVARPTTLELARLERQIVRLERSVEKVAGHADAAAEAGSLLASLADQRGRAAQAAESLSQIEKLHRRLSQQSADARAALASFDGLRDEAARIERETCLAQADLQHMLAEHHAGLDRVHRTVGQWNDLYDRLARAASLGDDALEASDRLLALQADLVCGGGDGEAAREALAELFALRRQLEQQAGLDQSQRKLEQLIGLKELVLDHTGDLAAAIETLELSADLHRQFDEVNPSLRQMRHWLTEILVMQPTFERAMATLRPLLELGSLRRLDVEQIRQIADSLQQQRRQRGSADGPLVRSPTADTNERPAPITAETAIFD